MDNVKGFVVTEENLAAAINNAPYWARRRLLKKMGKRIHSTDVNAKGELVKTARMPKDLEQYVENFTFTYGGKLEETATVPSV